jgi:hypothetical protein
MTMATPVGAAFLLGGMVMGLTCSPFLDTRGNPRSGSPDRAAATSRRRYLIGGAVLGVRGVFCGCWMFASLLARLIDDVCLPLKTDLQSAMYLFTNIS